MPRDGSGNYSRHTTNSDGSSAWQDQAAIDEHIYASEHDIHDEDMATAISGSLAANGEKIPTANLPMGGYKHTGVGDSTTRTDYAKTSQVQDNSYNFGGNTSGTGSAYTLSVTPAITAYSNGSVFAFRVTANSNSGATLNINSVGARNIKHASTGANIGTDDLTSGMYVVVIYSSVDSAFYLVSRASKEKLAYLSITGTLSVAGDTTLGNVSATGTLDVDGASTFNDDVTIGSAKTLNVSNISCGGAQATNITTHSDIVTGTYRTVTAGSYINQTSTTSSTYRAGTILSLEGNTYITLGTNSTEMMRLTKNTSTWDLTFPTDNRMIVGSATAAAQTVYTYGISAKSGTANASIVVQANTGGAVNLCPNGSSSPYLALGTTGRLSFTPPSGFGSSSKNPASDAVATWVEIKISGTTYYVPAYTA